MIILLYFIKKWSFRLLRKDNDFLLISVRYLMHFYSAHEREHVCLDANKKRETQMRIERGVRGETQQRLFLFVIVAFTFSSLLRSFRLLRFACLSLFVSLSCPAKTIKLPTLYLPPLPSLTHTRTHIHTHIHTHNFRAHSMIKPARVRGFRFSVNWFSCCLWFNTFSKTLASIIFLRRNQQCLYIGKALTFWKTIFCEKSIAEMDSEKSNLLIKTCIVI